MTMECPRCLVATAMSPTGDPSGHSLGCPRCGLIVRFELGGRPQLFIAEDPDQRDFWIWDQDALRGAADC